jgi:glucose-1-phosphate thymidylyltransferase
MIKGVVLAGGMGSRLLPLTRITNKHLLPVYDKPMIFYPLRTLVAAGIRDVLIVTGFGSVDDFRRLLGDGHDFGLHRLHYASQQGEGGIADALRVAEEFADGTKICVMLGDNIIGGGIRAARESFERQNGAKILLKEVSDPKRFGVPEFQDGRIVRVEEKPKRPKSSYAVIGIYFYDNTVFDRIRKLQPSARGEYEITDVNNSYLAEGSLRYELLEGWWIDAGTFESLWHASSLVREKVTRQAEVPAASATERR